MSVTKKQTHFTTIHELQRKIAQEIAFLETLNNHKTDSIVELCAELSEWKARTFALIAHIRSIDATQIEMFWNDFLSDNPDADTWFDESCTGTWQEDGDIND